MKENIIKYAALRNKLRNATEQEEKDEINKQMDFLSEIDEDLKLYKKESDTFKVTKVFSSKGREILDMICEAQLEDAYNVSKMSIEELITLEENLKNDSISRMQYRKYLKKRYGKSSTILSFEKECGYTLEDPNFPVEQLIAKAYEYNKKFEEESNAKNVKLALYYCDKKNDFVEGYAQIKGISASDADMKVYAYESKLFQNSEISKLEKECGYSIDDSNFPVERLFAKALECEQIIQEEKRLGSPASAYRDALNSKVAFIQAYAKLKGITEGQGYVELSRRFANNSVSLDKSDVKISTISHSIVYTTGIIIVNDSKSEIQVNKRTYPFSKILNFKVNDDVRTYQEPASYETKKSTSSMLGRALVGGILTGGLGAVVGAVTAKSNTVQKLPSNSFTRHNYTIIISIDDIYHPIEKLEIGSIQQKVEEISSVLYGILNKNKQHAIPTSMSSSSNNSIVDELKKLADLKRDGILTEEEFNQQKAKLLNR